MKYFRLLLLAIVALAAGSTQAKVKVRQTPVYVFGYSLSPTDSTIYITGIQRIDSAHMEKKTKMLISRSYYSEQLQQHLEHFLGVRGSICTVLFHKKIETLTKKRTRVMARAQKYPDYRVTIIDDRALTFRAAPWDEDMTPQLAPKEKHTKKKAKK